MSEQALNELARLGQELDAEDRFKKEVQAVIDRSKLNQFTAAAILEDLAKEQMAEWDDREPG